VQMLSSMRSKSAARIGTRSVWVDVCRSAERDARSNSSEKRGSSAAGGGAKGGGCE